MTTTHTPETYAQVAKLRRENAELRKERDAAVVAEGRIFTLWKTAIDEWGQALDMHSVAINEWENARRWCEGD